MLTRKQTCDCSDIPPIEEQFQEIMNYFDFRHVQMMMEWDKARVDYNDDGSHMSYHKWETFHRQSDDVIKDLGNPANYKVPTVLELRKDAERLLKEVIRLAKVNPRVKFHMVGTGPFKAIYRYGIIELECVFENWSCD